MERIDAIAPQAVGGVEPGQRSDAVPINFVHGDIDRWRDVAAPGGSRLTLDELAPRIRMGREIWIVQAFHLLRQRGYNVTLGDCAQDDAINVVHRDDLGQIADPENTFIVSVRADREPAFLAAIEIVQNQASCWRATDIYIPHWPQPGLLPRDDTRASRIENVVFFGKDDNLCSDLRGGPFYEALKQRGMTLELRSDDWWDYRTTDVVLAVRPGQRFFVDLKPASKLVNAWLAGCPAILNPEAGYRELRRSDLDYLEADSASAVLAALDRLRADPALYRAMVENGRGRARDHTADAVATAWEHALSHTIVPSFWRWRQRSQSRARRRAWLALARLRQRIWGTQAVRRQNGALHDVVQQIRRGLSLPGSLLR